MKEFKNIFSTPLFVIIFRPEILLFVTHSFLTGLTKVEFVIYWVLSRHGHYGNMGCQIPKGGKNLYAYIFGRKSTYNRKILWIMSSDQKLGIILEKLNFNCKWLKVSWFRNAFFGVFNSSKKQTRNFKFLPWPTGAEIFITFFGRIEKNKISFRN